MRWCFLPRLEIEVPDGVWDKVSKVNLGECSAGDDYGMEQWEALGVSRSVGSSRIKFYRGHMSSGMSKEPEDR